MDSVQGLGPVSGIGSSVGLGLARVTVHFLLRFGARLQSNRLWRWFNCRREVLLGNVDDEVLAQYG